MDAAKHQERYCPPSACYGRAKEKLLAGDIPAGLEGVENDIEEQGAAAPNPTEKKSKPARDALMAKIMQMLEEQPPPKFLVEIRELRQFRLDQTKGLANACAMLSALPSSWTGW